MAFTTTVRGVRYGGVGSCQIYGEWTGSAGDAAGTMTVGGTVVMAVFQKFDPIDQTYQIIPRVEVSINTTTNISTITVENQDNVTLGKFLVDKLSA